MRQLTWTLKMASTALLALALITSVGSASRAINIAPAGPIEAGGPIVINESLRLSNIRCTYALRGNLNPRINKSGAGTLPGGVMGQLTSTTAIACVDNFRIAWMVTFLIEINSQIRYNAFLGTLPAITGILATKLNVGVRIVAGRTNCLFRGDVGILFSERGGRQRFDQFRFLADQLRPIEGTCGMTAFLTLEGTVNMTPVQTVTLA